MKHGIATFAACLILGGCASGYSQFYQPNPNADSMVSRRVAPAPEEPALEHAYGDPSETLQRYMRRGYVVLGVSSFNSGEPEDDDDAIEQGADIGADLVVVLQPRHTETRTSSIPITTPTSTTSYTNGTATAYGSGGLVTAQGSATTTTYGTRTTYFPVTIQRFDYGAIYLVKVRQSFGAFFRELSNEERRELQTNRGVLVTTIVDDTPAFASDILPGDVIVSFGGEQVSGPLRVQELIQQNRGRETEIELLRNGNRLSKVVTLRD